MAESSAAISLTHEGEHILSPSLPYDINARADQATADPQLQQYIDTATRSKDQARQRVLGEAFGDKASPLRDLAGQIKQHTLDHLDHYLAQFIDRAEAAGATVHLARDGEHANAIAAHIAQQRGAKTCVKSKSMVTEETHLGDALAAVGCEAIETDLGEFILQLDDDAPSHIVTPMIHKNRQAVGRAFERELGVEYTEDAERLTMIARQHLRQKFREAELGISGANFLVAESGSVVICTNEGNGRLCTSVPDTHIAFAGIEKVIPRLQDLSVMLKLLARSSTGQPLTVYTHTMTGPRRIHEHDGPTDMHIVLIDNGRSDVLKPETREMLRCIRCGACLNACPVYRKIGGHSYGAVYSGPIGAILTPMLKGVENYPDLPRASSLCGACYEACPVKINIPKHLIRLRSELVSRHIEKRMDRLFMRLWVKGVSRKWRYLLGGAVQRRLLRLAARCCGTRGQGGDPYADRGYIRSLPGPVKGWTDVRDLPTPPSRSFRDWWQQRQITHPSSSAPPSTSQKTQAPQPEHAR
jgi:L-lactate dehydrogenase complex protein LldF